MRTIVLCAAMLMFSACAASPNPPSASSPPVAATSPDDTPKPVFSPDGSVRRAKLEEISTGRAPLPSECEGDACGVVTVTWLDPGYRFENTGTREVAIKIWFVSKEDCVRQEITLAAGKTSGWGNVGFCKPYTVSYR
jgi:hypothetical protein